MADAERVKPHDLDAEAAVLSACILDPSALDRIEDVLPADDFYSEAHVWIYRACQAIRATGKEIDSVLVATWLRDEEKLVRAGGIEYLHQVLNAAPAVHNVRHYAEIVRGKAVIRATIQACETFTAIGYARPGPADEFVGRVATRIHEIATASETSTGAPIREVLAETIKRTQRAGVRGAHILGVPTGLDRYDRMTSGLHPGELTIIAARPGMGKTALATGIAVEVANYTGESEDEAEPHARGSAVEIFSMEMPKEQLVSRMLCAESMVDVGRMRTGMLAPSDWSKLSKGAQALSNLTINIHDKPAVSMVELRAKTRRARTEAELSGKRLRLIVVDYLQLMGPDDKDAPREQQVSALSRGLKNLAMEMHVSVIALSQLNRAVETRGEKSKRPQLSDLRESGAIEQDADNICFVYREDYYKRDSAERNVAELIIAKQRNGPTDTVKVKWDGQYTRFDDLPEGQFTEDYER